MTLLFLAPFGFSWLLMASAGLPCSSTESEGQGGCANQKALGAALVQMNTLHSSMRVVADEGEDGQNTGLGHALDLVNVLADKSGGHSWNMSSDERLALQTIKDMIQDLFNGSLIQFREDQLEVDAARDRISNCTNDVRNTHNDVITPKKQKADQSRTEHKQCRERENKIIANTSQECTTYHNYRTTESNFDPFPTCMSTQLTFAKISTTDDTVLQSMESCLVDTINTLRPLYHEHAGCKESNDLRKNVSVECKREQGEFEADFCHYASQLATKCNTYSGCRSTSVGARNSTHAAVGKSEAARKADWKTGTHIQCLLGVFESDNVNKSALLKDCAWANVSTSNITIAYHAIPPEDPCPVEGNEPCDNAWLQTEYMSKAWYNSSTISACTPCQAPTPSPPPFTTAEPTPAPPSSSALVIFDGPVRQQDLTVSPGAVGGRGGGRFPNAAASRSIADASESRGISFKISNGWVSFFIGITTQPTTLMNSYHSLQLSIRAVGNIRATTPEVFEQGAFKYPAGNLANNGDWANDVYSIEVNASGVVNYKRNGNVFMTSERAMYYPWHVFVEMNTGASPSGVHEVKYLDGLAGF